MEGPVIDYTLRNPTFGRQPTLLEPGHDPAAALHSELAAVETYVTERDRRQAEQLSWMAAACQDAFDRLEAR